MITTGQILASKYLLEIMTLSLVKIPNSRRDRNELLKSFSIEAKSKTIQIYHHDVLFITYLKSYSLLSNVDNIHDNEK